MASKITIDPRTIVNWTTNTEYRIEVTEGLVKEIGNNRKTSPAVSNQQTFTTFSSGPYTTASYYSTATNAFISTATITFNRQLRPSDVLSNNFHLVNTETGNFASFNLESPEVEFDGKQTIKVTLNGMAIPDGDYYFSVDEGVFTDNFNFPNIPQSVLTFSTGTSTWHQTSIAGMTDENYNGNTVNFPFSLDTPQIIDMDASTETVYTLTLSSPIGSFLSATVDPSVKLQVKLENNLVDDSSPSTSLTLNNGTWSNTSKFGKYSIDWGNNASLSSNYINGTSNNLNLGTGDFTIEAWVYPYTHTRQAPYYYHKVFATSNEEVTFSFNDSGTSTTNWELFLGNTVVGQYFGLGGLAPVTANQWNHIFVARSGTTIYFGCNGTVYSNRGTTSYSFNFNNFRLGGSQSIGKLDSVRVSNKAVYPVSGTYTMPTSEFNSTFVSTSTGGVYVASTTKSIINNLFKNIAFVPVTDINTNSTYSYTLSKRDIQLVSKTLGMYGIPFDLGGDFILSTTTPSRQWHQHLNLHAILTTSTTITGVESGQVSFKVITKDGVNSDQVFGTLPFTNNTASISDFAADVGTYTVQAQWEGRSISPRYNPRNSNFITLNASERSDFPGQLILSVSTSGYQLNYQRLSVTSTFATATTGIVYLQDISTGTAKTLATGELINGVAEFLVNPNEYSYTENNSHNLQVLWEGQPWTAGSYDPYWEANSTIAIQNITTASLTQSLNTTTISIADPLIVKVVANTSTVSFAGSVSVREGGVIVGTTSTQNNSATNVLQPGFFTSGTYLISSQWNDTVPLVESTETTLIVNNRAPYQGTITINSVDKPTYQLDPVRFTISGSISTATTGTVSLYEVVTGSNVLLTTAQFTGSNSVSFNFNPNSFITSGTNHTLKAVWEGQDWVPGVFYPYESVTSANTTQSVRLAILSAQSRVPSNIETLPTTFVASLNTTTAYAGTVSWYLNNNLIDTVNTVGTSATITLSSGTMVLGDGNNIKAVLNNTYPLVVSNTVTQTMLEYKVPTFYQSTITNSFTYYNQDETVNTGTLNYSVIMSGNYSGHSPLGTIRLIDSSLNELGTASLTSSTSFQSIGTVQWNPHDRGQTLGAKSITIEYSGDDWNKTTSTSAIVNLIKPTASLTIAQTSTMTYFVGYPVTLTVSKNSDTVLSNGIKIRNLANNVTYGSSLFADNISTVEFNTGTASSTIVKAVYDEDTYHNLSSSTAITITTIREPMTRMRGGRTTQVNDSNPSFTYFSESDTYYVTDIITFKAKLWKKTDRPLTGRFRISGQSYSSFSREANYGTPSKPQSFDIQIASKDLNGTETVGTLTDITFTATAVMSMNGSYGGLWGWFEGSTLFAPTSVWSADNGASYILSGQSLSVIKNPVTLSVEYLKNGQYYTTWPYTPGDTIQGYRITRTSTRGIAWNGTMTASNTNGSATFVNDVATFTTNRIDYGIKGAYTNPANSSEDNYHEASSLVVSDPYPNGVVVGNSSVSCSGNFYTGAWDTAQFPLIYTLSKSFTTGPVNVSEPQYTFEILTSIAPVGATLGGNYQYESWTPPAGSEASITLNGNTLTLYPAKPPVGRIVNTTVWIGITSTVYSNGFSPKYINNCPGATIQR